MTDRLPQRAAFIYYCASFRLCEGEQAALASAGIKHESCLWVCLLSAFRSNQKSQGHELLAICLIRAYLNHCEARVCLFAFFFENLSLFNT